MGRAFKSLDNIKTIPSFSNSFSFPPLIKAKQKVAFESQRIIYPIALLFLPAIQEPVGREMMKRQEGRKAVR